MNHFNVHQLPAPRLAAEWHNRLQKLAEEHPPGHPGDHLFRPAACLLPQRC